MFLITPQTSIERIRFIDSISNAFIYMVGSSAVTGAQNSFGNTQSDYFERIEAMKLKAPQIVGFGIFQCRNFSTSYFKCKRSNNRVSFCETFN